ncbi:MAG: DUF2272 domain-containing protein [Bacteroidia bacterium]|nr:DUF2272 domain-containing protein [Bacteroidia bacterium]
MRMSRFSADQLYVPSPTSQYEVGSTYSRKSVPNIRWVQASLNRILGLRLVVDGIMGPRTRDAVRRFQNMAGIATDGVVGARTKAALIRAGAQPPKAGAGSTSASMAPAQAVLPAPGTPISALAKSIRSIALGELQRWGNGSMKESDIRMRPVLYDYWLIGTGLKPETLTHLPSWWSAVPWSAAFISWVMRHAGAGNTFKYSPSHSVYTLAAKQNRITNNANPLKAFRLSEARPQVGDIVCRRRAGSGATYDNLTAGMPTHCDIVVAVQPGTLITVGGNVRDSVSSTRVPIDSEGFIQKPGYFAVLSYRDTTITENERFMVEEISDELPVYTTDLLSFEEVIKSAPAPGIYEIYQRSSGGSLPNFKRIYVGKARSLPQRLQQHAWCLTHLNIPLSFYRVRLRKMSGANDAVLRVAERKVIDHHGRHTLTNQREFELPGELWGWE